MVIQPSVLRQETARSNALQRCLTLYSFVFGSQSTGVDRAIRRDAIVIDMTSTQPSEARDHAARLSGLGLVHLDAPMSGGVQLKDLRNALSTAEEIGFDAPVTQLFERLYSSGVADGLGDLDHAGLFIAMASHNAMN